MTKEMLKGLIELVSEEDIETLYNVVVKFIPENVPLPDEIEAIERADKSIAKNFLQHQNSLPVLQSPKESFKSQFKFI